MSNVFYIFIYTMHLCNFSICFSSHILLIVTFLVYSVTIYIVSCLFLFGISLGVARKQI